ncbi:hypothetical protein CKA32_000222 [Geitlerinema sp. FC II]|nr:hypothetical protein CKA32_000222 [Geitlerinema sp. FC II]
MSENGYNSERHFPPLGVRRSRTGLNQLRLERPQIDRTRENLS